ncbi:hypothetical protein PENANT_c015G00593 [Penicillium antarcticum]|uniref:CFEM domain-containing protein n=1 Tax=Penicillium antarcticum TaxID=416450 RepID=A0A1V6Q3C6_9EURO|nr:uncharacterized protein N7508_004902 [Penicillium antarcticum]KAJ5305887.1 hypothetical protein N7508_004902 [Penicillium antarcticum]OQD83734.1 hypothetical protein PENANT_c015G00593 [Penicillium antarcticum]
MPLAPRFSALFALLALLTTTLAADKNLIPTAASSTFPTCGLTCSQLYAAQDTCTQAADSSTWVSCFCQSSLISNLKTSGAVCSECGTDDQAKVSTWYTNYCNSGGKETSNTATTTSSAASSTATSTSGSSANSNKSSSETEENKSWWSTHYQWVIMLIVLAIGFGIIAALGVWFKRRYDAKRPNLYHGGSSGVLSTASPPSGPRDAAWDPAPMPIQGRGLGAPSSVASSSLSNVAPKVSTPVSGSRSRLTKIPQETGDVEVRQV